MNFLRKDSTVLAENKRIRGSMSLSTAVLEFSTLEWPLVEGVVLLCGKWNPADSMTTLEEH